MNRYALTLAVLAPLAATACITEDDAAPAEVAPPPSVEAQPKDPIWEDLGPARIAGEAQPNMLYFESAGPPMSEQGADAADAKVTMRLVDMHEKRAYRVTIDRASLSAISAAARERGVEAGMLPDAAAPRPDLVVSDGWSNNDDSRTRRTNTTTYPYSAIGTLYDGGGDCTGTRIGRRIVLTAAHCIYDRDTASFSTINFKPGRNGSTSAPYGSSGPHWYWVPEEYMAGAPNLNGYDIAVIVLDTPVGNGYLGYGAWSGATLATKDLWMRGYPRCATEGAPEDCAPKTLWGDTKVCDLGTFFDVDGDGWNRQIKTNCDGSAGQSGSSFYFYTSNNVPASTGVFSHHYCLAGCPDSVHNAWPNVITRITPTYLDVINYFQAKYP